MLGVLPQQLLRLLLRRLDLVEVGFRMSLFLAGLLLARLGGMRTALARRLLGLVMSYQRCGNAFILALCFQYVRVPIAVSGLQDPLF